MSTTYFLPVPITPLAIEPLPPPPPGYLDYATAVREFHEAVEKAAKKMALPAWMLEAYVVTGGYASIVRQGE